MTIGPAPGGYASRILRHEQTRDSRVREPAFSGPCGVALGAVFAVAVFMLGLQEIGL